LGAVEEATAEAAKHVDRSEPLAALVTEARETVEQARAAEAERARVAAEEAAAAERQRLEEQVAALTLVMQSAATQLQEAQAQLGVPPAAPAPHPDYAEDQCVMCFDAPKDHIIIPCGHVCVCEACANLLTQMSKPLCPICRTAIQHTNKVFHSGERP
jgi:rubrerythrin